MQQEGMYIRVPAPHDVQREKVEGSPGQFTQAEDRLTGKLEGIIEVIAPVHVGTGDLALAASLEPMPEVPQDEDVPLIAPFFRVDGWLTIPGASLKGAFRHLFELITRSCFAQYNRFERRGGYDVDRDLQSCAYRADSRGRGKFGNKLCPACRVFGGLGWQGRINFGPAHVKSGGSRVEFAPQRWGPKLRPQDADRRKVYTHEVSANELIEPVEVLASGTELALRLDFQNLTRAELGLLLIVLGQEEQNPIYPKIGGLKAHGFGGVAVRGVAVTVMQPDDAYMNYDAGEVALDDLQGCIAEAKDSVAFYRDGYGEMVKVLGEEPEAF